MSNISIRVLYEEDLSFSSENVVKGAIEIYSPKSMNHHGIIMAQRCTLHTRSNRLKQEHQKKLFERKETILKAGRELQSGTLIHVFEWIFDASLPPTYSYVNHSHGDFVKIIYSITITIVEECKKTKFFDIFHRIPFSPKRSDGPLNHHEIITINPPLWRLFGAVQDSLMAIRLDKTTYTAGDMATICIQFDNPKCRKWLDYVGLLFLQRCCVIDKSPQIYTERSNKLVFASKFVNDRFVFTVRIPDLPMSTLAIDGILAINVFLVIDFMFDLFKHHHIHIPISIYRRTETKKCSEAHDKLSETLLIPTCPKALKINDMQLVK